MFTACQQYVGWLVTFPKLVFPCIRSEHRPPRRGGVEMFEALIIVMCFGILYVEIIAILDKLDRIERLHDGARQEVHVGDQAALSHQTR
jgi:hypothetical protein